MDKPQGKYWGRELPEEELEESFIHGSGPGGQKINKTASCVVLRHLPTGLMVRCQRERSREANRKIARDELLRRLRRIETIAREKARSEREKERRRKRQRPPGVKARILDSKRRRSAVKRLRRPGESDNG